MRNCIDKKSCKRRREMIMTSFTSSRSIKKSVAFVGSIGSDEHHPLNIGNLGATPHLGRELPPIPIQSIDITRSNLVDKEL